MSFISKPIQSLVDWATSNPKKKVYQLYEGSLADQSLLTSKFASLCELWRLGIPTPPSAVITTEAAAEYHENGDILPEPLVREYTHQVLEMEHLTGKVFGSKVK
jgi:phosphoenolpyruvate synthase/pyruvate phosphate dikinase